MNALSLKLMHELYRKIQIHLPHELILNLRLDELLEIAEL